MRGEYGGEWDSVPVVPELPPRARRIQLPKIEGFAHIGTTSACAENTGGIAKIKIDVRNYLRVRGEYLGSIIELLKLLVNYLRVRGEYPK